MWISSSRLFLFIILGLGVTAVHATPGINMPYGASTISHQIYDLHMACFYICCVIGAGTFGVLFYSLFRYRHAKGAVAAPFHEHLWVEILWTIIPTLILVGLAIPATKVLKEIHNTDASEMTIKITGYQWKWKYDYLDQGISFFSSLSSTQAQINGVQPRNQWFLLEVDNPVVVPVDTKVRLLVTADDVIHDWWVPELGVKQDAIPGFINENWVYITKPGTYRGQCAELCGLNHAFMPIVVEAVSKEDFAKWVQTHQKNNTLTMNSQEQTIKQAKAAVFANALPTSGVKAS
jgi:cytochrome c oxidase subunit II